MAIADLYDADNVVVGQAALFLAAQDTPLPTWDLANLDDPFDPSPWLSYKLVVGSAGTPTLSYLGAATSAIATTTTAAALQTLLEGLATIGVGNVKVTGSTAATPGLTIVLNENVAVSGGLTAVGSLGSGGSLTGGLWQATGATDAGYTFGTNKSTQAITIEEQSTQVGTNITTQAVTIGASLAEDITRTLALAYNANVAQHAATSTLPGADVVTLSDDVIYYAAALVMQNELGFPRWVYAPKWSQLTNTSTALRRSADKHMFPVEFNTACKPSEIEIINFRTRHTP